MRKLAFGMLLALAGSALASPALSDTVKIGFPTCLSGPGAAYGQTTSNAVKLAIDEVNSSGAAGDHKLEIVIADGKCSPREAGLAADKLVIQDNVQVLLGGVASSASLAVKAVAEREKVPMLEGVAGTNALTQKGNKYVFRLVPNLLMYTDFAVDYLCNQLKPKKVAYVFQNTDFGKETVELSKEGLTKCGAKEVGWFPGRPDETNFQTVVTQLKSADPDLVFIIHWPPPAISFLRQAHEAGLKAAWFNVGSLSGPGFTAKAGSLAEGFLGVNVFEPSSQRPKAKAFAANYKKRYGSEPDWFAAGYYTCVLIAADAVKRGGPTREGIAKALAETKGVDTLLGPISFDDTGQAPSFFTLFEYKDGKRNVKVESQRVGQRYIKAN